MADIPADVMAAAAAACDEILKVDIMELEPEQIIARAIVAQVAAERDRCAQWHDRRARETPDAFEMEFHQVSAAAIRRGSE